MKRNSNILKIFFACCFVLILISCSQNSVKNSQIQNSNDTFSFATLEPNLKIRNAIEAALSTYVNNQIQLKTLQDNQNNSQEKAKLILETNKAKAIGKKNLEKALQVNGSQLEFIRTYSYAYLVFHDQKYLTAAKNSAINITTPSKSLAKNGFMIEALAMLYRASSNLEYLDTAINLAQSSVDQYKHSFNKDSKYSIDQLYLAQALLILYEVSAKKEWLYKSINIADFIANKFTISSSLEENIDLARFFNLLYHYSGNPIYKQMAGKIIEKLSAQKTNSISLDETGISLVNFEINNDPAHFTLIGPKNNPQAKKLFTELLRSPFIYSRIEWYDPQEGKLPNADVEYPNFDKPVAFNCANKVCSMPVFELKDLQEKLKL